MVANSLFSLFGSMNTCCEYLAKIVKQLAKFNESISHPVLERNDESEFKISKTLGWLVIYWFTFNCLLLALAFPSKKQFEHVSAAFYRRIG